MYTLIVRSSFEASHCIPGHSGKCAQLHGHTYRVEAEFTGGCLNDIGMLEDFGDLRKVLEDVLPDHRHLNDVMDVTPTAENLARWIFRQVADRGLPITSLTVWETDRYGCRYTESEDSHAQGGS
jgi:6-pyruvoyltetrahydropterin/6-carboxytetrahydropterin synthase